MSKTDNEALEELRKIRALLEPKPAPPAPEPKGLWQEFKSFIEKYKVMGLAIAFIIGIYLGGLVQSLAKDLLLPVIGLAIPGINDLATLTYVVGEQSFGVGNFLVALITFLVVAVVVFLMVKVTNRWGIK
ncbi:MAG: MscL family protein [Candidatus Bathyarchaeota archaeon]|nr:MscL family protein [Candidatus Bathyarchaeota archaeon]